MVTYAEYDPAAGWSSMAARRVHTPEVAGSSPAPATTPSRVDAAGWSHYRPGDPVHQLMQAQAELHEARAQLKRTEDELESVRAALRARP